MKKILCLFGALALLLSSCSSDESSSDLSSVLLKKQISTDSEGFKVITNYKYDGNKLVDVTFESQPGGLYFTYAGDLISKIEFKYDGVVEQVNTYEYNSNKQLISFVRIEPSEGLGSKEVYTYNVDGSVSVKSYSGDEISQTLFDGEGKITFVNGEVDEIISDYSPSRSYTYDDKNNVMKNVLGYDKISFADGEANGILHNIVSEKSGGEVMYTNVYTYNSSNYPTKSVESENGETATEEFFY